MAKKPKYDLEDQTLQFSKDVRRFVRKIPPAISNTEDCKQLVKASGSVGANYIEANEALSRKDFKFRVKISRKEAKESRYWLRLIDTKDDSSLEQNRIKLGQEATELLKIFSAILNNSK